MTEPIDPTEAQRPDVPVPQRPDVPAAQRADVPVPQRAAASSYTMPDLTDLASAPQRKQREPAKLRLQTIGIVGGLLLFGGGFAVGHFTTHSGPSTLVEAVAQASTGQLPCGTPPTSATGAGGGAFITRLCQGGGGAGGGLAGGAGGGTGATPGTGGGGFGGGGAGGLGGLFGPGAVTGTVTSVAGNSITVQTRAGNVVVTLPAAAAIEKTAAGTAADLLAKSTVVVNTTQDSAGNRTATHVLVLPAPATTS